MKGEAMLKKYFCLPLPNGWLGRVVIYEEIFFLEKVLYCIYE